MPKILTAKPHGTWDRNGETFHQIMVTLDDGTVGEVNAKSPDRWQAGDDVVIQKKTETNYGLKLKLDKAEYANQGPRRENRTPVIESSWAIQTAVSYLAMTMGGGTPKDVLEAARKMLTLRDQLTEERTNQ